MYYFYPCLPIRIANDAKGLVVTAPLGWMQSGKIGDLFSQQISYLDE